MSIIRSSAPPPDSSSGRPRSGSSWRTPRSVPDCSTCSTPTSASARTKLSVGHWISDGLLAIFFFIVAVELKHELVVGELNSLKKAIHPAIAAVGGVIVPAGDLSGVHRRQSGSGRAGRSPRRPTSPSRSECSPCSGAACPNRLRVFLLALAVLDDLIAILIIAVFFTTDPNLLELGLAAVDGRGSSAAQPFPPRPDALADRRPHGAARLPQLVAGARTPACTRRSPASRSGW